jgi:hypothetical protein
MLTSLVLTTIYKPNKNIITFSRQCKKHRWNFIVIGDKKTPYNFKINYGNYFSFKQQKKIDLKFSVKCPANNYARKNIGYLYAIQNGATAIFDTDDDTFLRKSAINYFENFDKCEFYEVTGGDLFNPYLFYARGSEIWPRGYPLRHVSPDKKSLREGQTISKLNQRTNFDILQTLVNSEPDVDAVYRMTVTDKISDFDVSPSIIKIQPGVFTPGNTQSTLWTNEKKFKYLYIPRWVSFRFCDILKMYIAQKNSELAYAGFWTDQIRNPHDYMIDFKSEIECYLQTEPVIEYLKQSNKSNLRDIYQDLNELGIGNEMEVEAAGQFEQIVSDLLE